MKDRTRNARRVGVVAPDPRPLLECPECETPALAADFLHEEYGWRWTDDARGFCPKCGIEVYVSVTDDYEEDCIAVLKARVS